MTAFTTSIIAFQPFPSESHIIAPEMPPAFSRVCFYGYQDDSIDDVERMVERAINRNARNGLITVPLAAKYDCPDHERRYEKVYQPGIFSSRLWQAGQELKVGFVEGTEWQRDQVKRYAPEWTRHANIKFIFLTDSERMSTISDILVSFDTTQGSWACWGTDCSYFSVRGYPSMNLAWIIEQRSQVDNRAIILHQFGHALGLVHEHATIHTSIPLDKDQIFKDLRGPPCNWTLTKTEQVFPTDNEFIVQQTASDNCSIMQRYYPPNWVHHGKGPRYNADISERDKDYIRFYYPHQSQRVGHFNTMEISPNSTPIPVYAKDISFQEEHAHPPVLIVGINWLDIESAHNLRIRARAVEQGHWKLTASISTWMDTEIYSAGMNWIEVGPKLQFLQHGAFSTTELHPAEEPWPDNSKTITFSTPFSVPPKVVCFLTDIDMNNGNNFRITAYPSDIKPDRFTINIESWEGTILHEARVTWLAYPADQPGVASGCIDTNDFRTWQQPQQNNSAWTAFSKPFSKIPNVFLALNTFDYEHKMNIRLRVSTSLVTRTGFHWHLHAWWDSIMYRAGASYFAWED